MSFSESASARALMAAILYVVVSPPTNKLSFILVIIVVFILSYLTYVSVIGALSVFSVAYIGTQGGPAYATYFYVYTLLIIAYILSSLYFAFGGRLAVIVTLPSALAVTTPADETDAFAFMGGAQNTNEECYLFQKAARLLGMAYVEHQARL